MNAAYQRFVEALQAHGCTVDDKGAYGAASTPGHSAADRGTTFRETRDGVIVYVHNGDKAQVLADLGLTLGDLYNKPRTQYDYPDGRKVVRAYRNGRKTFPQDGNKQGKALFGSDRLPDSRGALVLVVEGEADVIAAQAVGAFAVTQAQGAKTGPERADWSPLRGRPVLIVADKDDAGRARARTVAEHLAGIAASVTVAEAKDGNDLADHIAAGHDIEDLIGIGQVRTPVDPDPSASFWGSRPVLAHIRDTARILGASPWAVLGCVLCRAAASVEPNVKLPAIVAGYASLNLFCAAAGESGLGKGAADRAARQAIRFVDSGGRDIPVMPLNPGTGEGLAKAFMREDESTGEKTTRALLSINEIRTLESLMGRQGATLDSQLLQVFSGEPLGFNNASKLTTTAIAEHSYRLCVIVGVQPENAGSLLSAAKDGLPQRFLWVPVEDPYAPPPAMVTENSNGAADIPVIKPHKVQITGYKAEDVIMDVPAKVVNKIRMDRHLRITGADNAPLDSHRNLMQLKVAAALMILDGRCNQGSLLITLEDWKLAGTVLSMSDRVRSRMARILEDRVREANRARAELKADEAGIMADRAEDRERERVRQSVLRFLDRRGSGTRKELRANLHAPLRSRLDAELADLEAEGAITHDGASYRRASG